MSEEDLDKLSEQARRFLRTYFVDAINRVAREEAAERACAETLGTQLAEVARLVADTHAEAALAYKRALRRLDAFEGNQDNLCTNPACECHGGHELRCL
jgi:hypothetical protein